MIPIVAGANPETGARFPETQWTQVMTAQSDSAERALDQLCRTYWPPLYTFLRRSGKSPADSQDLVQGFLARFLARDDLGRVKKENGRFRSFLLTSLQNYVINQADRDRAAKRGAGAVPVPIDGESAEAICAVDLSAESPELAFDRRWARTVLSRAFQRLHEEQHARGHALMFEALAPFLEAANPGEYEEVSERLGMRRQTVAVTVHRLRQRLRELFLSEAANTVGPGIDPNAEVRELLTALAKP